MYMDMFSQKKNMIIKICYATFLRLLVCLVAAMMLSRECPLSAIAPAILKINIVPHKPRRPYEKKVWMKNIFTAPQMKIVMSLFNNSMFKKVLSRT